MAQVILELGNFLAPGGLTGLGYTRVLELHPFGTCGQTNVHTAFADESIGLAVVRLGIDCPCGAPFEAYAVHFSFRIADQPGSQSQVTFTFWNTLLGGRTPYRDILLEVTTIDRDVNFVSDTDAAIIPEQVTATIAATYPAVLTSTSVEGPVSVDVTAAYNAAKTAGRAFFNLRLRMADISAGDCLGGLSWYAVMKSLATTLSSSIGTGGTNVRPPGGSGGGGSGRGDPTSSGAGSRTLNIVSTYNPRLVLGAGTPDTLTDGFATFEWIVGEPEATEPTLFHLRDRSDFEHGHGIIKVRLGNTVRVEASAIDEWTVPGTYEDATLRLTLRDASGVAVLTNAVMNRIDKGIYAYEYVTQLTDALGIYTAEVDWDV